MLHCVDTSLMARYLWHAELCVACNLVFLMTTAAHCYVQRFCALCCEWNICLYCVEVRRNLMSWGEWPLMLFSHVKRRLKGFYCYYFYKFTNKFGTNHVIWLILDKYTDPIFWDIITLLGGSTYVGTCIPTVMQLFSPMTFRSNVCIRCLIIITACFELWRGSEGHI